MLSRVADNLYWFGRYLRRAENMARLINVNALMLLDLPPRVRLSWVSLVDIVGASDLYPTLCENGSEDAVVRFLTLEDRNPGSIRMAITRAREILRVSRDCIPRDMWERVSDLYFYVQDRTEADLKVTQRHTFLTHVMNSTMLINGMLMTNMSRDVGFDFLTIGTNIEQADMTTRILDVRATPLNVTGASLPAFENVQWMSVLRSLIAYQMYRKHARQRVTAGGVLRFVLQNRELPRSVSFCLASVAATLPSLPPNRPVERALERTRALVRDANLEALSASPSALAGLMDEIQIGLADLHAAFCAAYFASPAAESGPVRTAA